MTVNSKLRVAVVGATGLAGQQFLGALINHPWFEVGELLASKRSAGKSYRDAISVDGSVGCFGEGELPILFADMVVKDASSFDASTVDLVFSAVESSAAKELEPKYAKTTPVLSTASAFRYEDDVPLLLPGTNLEHAYLLKEQSKARGWKGFVAPNPNCTTVGLAITLAPLHKAFGVRRVNMVSMQAVSGAGRSPGVIALDVTDNVVPFIPGEERKVALETAKVLGDVVDGVVVSADVAISCTCTRIAVLEGHTDAVHLELERPATVEEIESAWRSAGAEEKHYPTAPDELIHVHSDTYRPQVRLDRDRGNGLTTTVGRLRPDESVKNGWQYMLVSHNTKMGAAKGCILVAEHLKHVGII